MVQNSLDGVHFFFVSEDAHCSETDLALTLTIFNSLIFEISLILYSRFVVNWRLRRIQKKNVC